MKNKKSRIVLIEFQMNKFPDSVVSCLCLYTKVIEK